MTFGAVKLHDTSLYCNYCYSGPSMTGVRWTIFQRQLRFLFSSETAYNLDAVDLYNAV